jgi:exopolysaccharide biosynthesis polyprenyl glycosylphosphotransferase
LDAIRLSEADTVIVTDSQHLGPDGMRELTWNLDGVNVELMVSPNMVDVSSSRMQLGQLVDEPFIHLQQPQYEEAGSVVKALFDLTAGATLFLFALPVLAAAVFAIKVSSRGPAFFRQERIGKDGKSFTIYKLRTMISDADQQLADLLKDQGVGDSPLFKVGNDPRITRVGRLFRRYSIDELPQLINVLKGEMSLVGPRPQRAEEVSLYDHKAHRRLTVRPGMTGLWQVSGRSDLAWEDAVRLDLYYVENWSMTADLLILWRTIRAVLRSDGAY